MSFLAFAFASLGAWTYSGFLAPPAIPAVQPVPPPVSPPSEPPAAPAPQPAEVEPAAAPPPPPLASKPDPAPASPAGTLYRLADASGQVWEHADPTWLQEFVLDRNRQLLGRPR